MSGDHEDLSKIGSTVWGEVILVGVIVLLNIAWIVAFIIYIRD